MKVHEALSAVMTEVGSVGKDGRVNIERGPTYNFRGVDAVANAVGPALRKHGCSLRPTGIIDKTYATFETKNGGVSHHCVVEVAYEFVGPEGDTLACVGLGEASDYGDKATPKAMSVAWRTAMIQLLTLPTDEPDPDEHVVERAPAQDPAAIAAQRTLLAEVCTAHPDEGDGWQRERARRIWDEHGKDPKRLAEMTAKAKEVEG